jgi:tetratricopeptide (TPR) repeat protein
MSRPCLDVTICATLAGLLVCAMPTQAQTQSSLSEKLSKTITDVKRSEGGGANPLTDIKSYEEMLGDFATNPTDKRRVALKSRAFVYEQAQEFDRAEADYTASTKLEPASAADFGDRGYFYLRTGRYGEAIADFVAGGQIEPKSSRYRFAIGRVHAAMRNYTAAIDHYTQAIRPNPRDSAAYLSRAESYVYLKKYAEAKSDYERAIKLGLPRPADKLFGYLGRGFVSLVTDDFDAAAADFEIAIRLEPITLNGWLWLAYANERRNRIDLAIDAYERALLVEPTNAVIFANLRRLRSKEPTAAPVPTFQIDERMRLAADSPPGILPRKRPQM